MLSCNKLYSALSELRTACMKATAALHKGTSLEIRQAYEALQKSYDIAKSALLSPVSREAYDQQVEYLRPLLEKKYGIWGFTAMRRFFQVPSYPFIVRKYEERCEADPAFALKAEQGFTRMLLIPRALRLQEIRTLYGTTLKTMYTQGQLHRQGKTLDQPGKKVETLRPMEADQLYYTDDTGNISADYNGQLTYNGKSKIDMVTDKSTTFAGWDVVFVEKDLNMYTTQEIQKMPRDAKRHPYPTGMPAHQYKNTLLHDPEKAYESGLDPDVWLVLANTIARQYGQLIDDHNYHNKGDFGIGYICYLLGATCAHKEPYYQDKVLTAYWDYNAHQVALGLWNENDADKTFGFRTMVRL